MVKDFHFLDTHFEKVIFGQFLHRSTLVERALSATDSIEYLQKKADEHFERQNKGFYSEMTADLWKYLLKRRSQPLGSKVHPCIRPSNAL